MKKKQYFVQSKDKPKREVLFNYITKYTKMKTKESKKDMMNSNFPFVVDYKTNHFWICNSITCCACAAQRNQIITVEEFMSMV